MGGGGGQACACGGGGGGGEAARREKRRRAEAVRGSAEIEPGLGAFSRGVPEARGGRGAAPGDGRRGGCARVVAVSMETLPVGRGSRCDPRRWPRGDGGGRGGRGSVSVGSAGWDVARCLPQRGRGVRAAASPAVLEDSRGGAAGGGGAGVGSALGDQRASQFSVRRVPRDARGGRAAFAEAPRRGLAGSQHFCFDRFSFLGGTATRARC